MKLTQILLYPLALLYGFVMMIRNLLFDLKIFRPVSFHIPVISVGNLSFGGTGKTPHIEYLIHLLKDKFFTGTLSRGYGRKSEGFVIASVKSTSKTIGDESLQYVQKFTTIKVAVDEKRVRGIRKLLETFPGLKVILLDDAYQHRWVQPGLSLLLTDYHQLYCEDHVFPAGRLREFSSGSKRADVIIVTKTPKIFSPITRRRIIEDLKPASHQKIFFSYIRYGNPVPVFHDYPWPEKLSYLLLFTGIANDYPIREHLERKCSNLHVLKFPDHHQYTSQDLEKIRKDFEDLPTQKKALITTEKDFMRLQSAETSNFVKNLPLFYLPIDVEFHQDDKTAFDNLVLNYVGKNQRDS
ncbi:MAG: tetraacyldisaccharide 4'-kinase [Syntrophothermus sp.]